VEKAIDKRGAIAAVGNLQAYTQYETASSIRDAANNPGGAAGVGMGLGAGVAMGAQMMNTMSAAAGAAAGSPAAGHVPPPIPGAAVFHVAMGQNRAGPFDMNTLQQQIARAPSTATPSCGPPAWRSG
jgi:hypothetical protein